jgi:hypothetical protein
VGNPQQPKVVQEVSTLQVEKWLRGNDIWVFALLEEVTAKGNKEIHTDFTGAIGRVQGHFCYTYGISSIPTI